MPLLATFSQVVPSAASRATRIWLLLPAFGAVLSSFQVTYGRPATAAVQTASAFRSARC